MAELDYTPRVEINDDTAITRLLLFTKWGGFFELKTRINRDKPGSLSDTTTPLIDYNCGIRF